MKGINFVQMIFQKDIHYKYYEYQVVFFFIKIIKKVKIYNKVSISKNALKYYFFIKIKIFRKIIKNIVIIIYFLKHNIYKKYYFI